MDMKHPQQLGQYKITQIIGKGASGSVYRCTDIDDKRLPFLVDGYFRENMPNQLLPLEANGLIAAYYLNVFAIKAIRIRHLDAKQRQDAHSELQLMSSLEPHTNIVRYVDSVNSHKFHCIVMEYAHCGSLRKILKEHSPSGMTERKTAFFLSQILCGLHSLHSQGIIHRDIKADNVLVTEDGVAKLADFGVAIKMGHSGDGELDQFPVGSPFWMAPEIISMSGPMTPRCDIWAVGATAIELFSGRHPYYGMNPMAAQFRIVEDPHPEIPGGASKGFTDFLHLCFQKNPALRPAAKALLQNEWLKTLTKRERTRMSSNQKVYGLSQIAICQSVTNSIFPNNVCCVEEF